MVKYFISGQTKCGRINKVINYYYRLRSVFAKRIRNHKIAYAVGSERANTLYKLRFSLQIDGN
jgi:hypothetical protein